ncbi:MAG: AAA family ATPase [Proteobacteria bacterium]|nr:AAA family ATPase [Pseudomonadota bacterium]
MYAPYFGLKQPPFSIAPDPRYLYMSERHREALAHLLYGLSGGGGFVLLSGEIGAGKTTVCRCFLEQIPRRCNVAYIFNPKLTALELLQSVCEEFRVPVEHAGAGEPTVKDHVDALNAFLLRTHAVGQDNVLIIDEAQMLSADVLEQLRLLTNLETNERKLLQIILIGQPELRGMLAQPELEQLAQRVIARFHLEALSDRETEQYIAHRMAVAGLAGPLPFDRKALQRISHWSRGVPRRINLLCDRALLGAYGSGTTQVTAAIVDRAAAEVFGKPGAAESSAAGWTSGRWAMLGTGLAAGLAVAGIAALALGVGTPRPGPGKVAHAAPAASGAASGATRVAAAASSAASSAASAVAIAKPASAPGWLASTDLTAGFSNVVRNEKDAWRELAPAWKLALGDAADPCAEAERQQVACYRSTGNTLPLIRQLGRPGILTLRDDASTAPAYALLVALSDQSATLRMGNTERNVSLALLARLWRGDYATYWRMPPGYENKIVVADSGPLADWLIERLAGLDGSGAASAPAGDAATFKARITSFQIAQGLKADGLAGATTFMQLNRAIGIDEPRLATSVSAP